MKILIVDDESLVRSFLQTAAQKGGHEIRVAGDGEEGWTVFEEFKPDLVLTDIEMPHLNGLELLSRIRETRNDVIVVVLTGHGNEEYAVEALRLKANNYLQKPVRHFELKHLFKKYESVVEARNLGQEAPGKIVSKNFTAEYDNRLLLVPRRADELVRQTGDIFDEKQKMGLLLGLVELLVNAIEHGNLGVTGQEKAAAMEKGFDAYQELLTKRLSDARLAARKVTVEYKQDIMGCEWLISDEGEGFKWREFIQNMSGENVFRTNCRGVYLSCLQFDQLEYLGVGNIVRASKLSHRSDS